VDKARAVVVVQDAFTSHFETRLVPDVLALLRKLGFEPLLAPFRPNGKPLHVHGFLGAFQHTAERNAALLRDLAGHDIPLVGIDPSITLSYRDEYPTALGADRVPRVQLLQEWLASRLEDIAVSPSQGHRFRLLPHCTEQSNAAASIGDWQRLFSHLGQELEIVAVGCCGMAGTYGHETGHVATSRKIYDLSWAAPVAAGSADLLATGYSCRSQVKRFGGVGLKHPAQALLEVMVNP
jgi:Fe-S oxidoreductase